MTTPYYSTSSSRAELLTVSRELDQLGERAETDGVVFIEPSFVDRFRKEKLSALAQKYYYLRYGTKAPENLDWIEGEGATFPTSSAWRSQTEERAKKRSQKKPWKQ
jgi:hypothetical protein